MLSYLACLGFESIFDVLLLWLNHFYNANVHVAYSVLLQLLLADETRLHFELRL